MGLILQAQQAANNADYQTIFDFTFDGEPVDFSGAYIEVEVKDFDGCRRIEASTTNGKISIVDLGKFQLSIPASEMKCLCAGTYPIGGLMQLNGETISLFTGSLPVIDGVARA